MTLRLGVGVMGVGVLVGPGWVDWVIRGKQVPPLRLRHRFATGPKSARLRDDKFKLLIDSERRGTYWLDSNAESGSVRGEHVLYVYLMASRSRTLYCGVTSDLETRVKQHQDGTFGGFTSKYRCTRLVWFERFVFIENAIVREKEIKGWRREKKIALIEKENPTGEDLSAGWGKQVPRSAYPIAVATGPQSAGLRDDNS